VGSRPRGSSTSSVFSLFVVVSTLLSFDPAFDFFRHFTHGDLSQESAEDAISKEYAITRGSFARDGAPPPTRHGALPWVNKNNRPNCLSMLKA
jgi:hypothetical protein